MAELVLKEDPRVKPVFERYPKEVKPKMLALRSLVLEVAKEEAQISAMEETLKWGEPSYLTKHGSTLRMDWKAKTPHQYAMYFKCTSRLVETFKTVFSDEFRYEGNRAIIFGLEESLPKAHLKQCIRATLMYHKVKNLPKLGM